MWWKKNKNSINNSEKTKTNDENIKNEQEIENQINEENVSEINNNADLEKNCTDKEQEIAQEIEEEQSNEENVSEIDEETILDENCTDKEQEIAQEIEEEQSNEEIYLSHISSLEEQLKNSHDKIAKYEQKLSSINDEYSAKVIEKAEQANKLIQQKIIEITNKNNEEILAIKKYAFAKDITGLLDIINQFNRMLNIQTNDEKIKNFQIGFKMISSMFNSWLNEIGVIEVPINIGDFFDETYMEVVDVVEDNSKKQNEIVSVISNAYKLHDRVVKFGVVKVIKNNI